MAYSQDDSLNWLALQYVLGEMSASDSEAFEERLADDADACEAVASASRLVRTAQVALTEPAVPAVPVMVPVKDAPRGSWLAVASAAIAAGLVFAVIPFQSADSSRTESAAQLVSLWRTGVSSLDTDSDEADLEPADASGEVAIPDWMIAAVSVEREGLSHERSDVQEN